MGIPTRVLLMETGNKDCLKGNITVFYQNLSPTGKNPTYYVEIIKSLLKTASGMLEKDLFSADRIVQ